MCRVREIQSFTLTWPQPGGQNMLVFSAVPCIIQYTNSKHHIIIPQTHGLIIAGQWALPLSVELLPTATGSYAGVIRSAVGSLNREINVCSTIGPRGLSQTREEPEPCTTRAASLSSCLFSLLSLPPDLHLSLFLSSSSSSSAVICLPSLSIYVHPFLFSLCPWLSFLSLLLSFVFFSEFESRALQGPESFNY